MVAVLRERRLLAIGISLTEQLNAPAAHLDWHLAVDDVIRRIENEKADT